MTVGSADDHAEVDADRRADEALGWLAAQRPMDQAPPQAHQHTAGCVGRAHAPETAGTIGREGGALDAGTQAEIQGAVGGGQALAPEVRGPMEQAFGADLGRVRVHAGEQADRLSRSMSADAFTTGSDIFFSRGAYAPDSPQGQRVLAHEIGHVMQNRNGVKRLWNPFKKKEKTDVDKARDANKAQDKDVRATAKKVNKDHKKLSESIKLSYQTAPNAKLVPPTALVAIQGQFQHFLDLEARARQDVADQHNGAGMPTTDPQELQRLQDQAGEAVWNNAPEEVRALRPLRFDDFDVALNEVRELAQEGRVQLQSQSAQLMQENESGLGALMDPEKAQKKVLEQRGLDRRQARANPDTAKLNQQNIDKGEKAVVKERAINPVGSLVDQRLRSNAIRKNQEEQFGENEDLNDAKKGLKTAGTIAGKGGKAIPKGLKQLTSNDEANDVGAVLGKSTTGLGNILTMISDILGFVGTIGDIKQGTADRGAKVQAASEATKVLRSAGAVTRTTLLAAKEGVEKFGGATEVIGQAGQGVPIVGLITSALGIIQSALDLVPLGERHSDGVTTVQQALLDGKAPLAASYDRVNSRNAQLIEKETFALAKNSTMLGLHIAEVATAGGFGVPMAAKLTLTITDLCHTLGHKIYDTVGESKSATALKGFKVKHQEGASRDVLKYDIGSSVDVIIVAAKKHKLGYARETLLNYGVTDAEIDTMWLDELREKVLDGLDAEGDPKTVTEKIEAAKDSVKDALGMDTKKGGGPKEETTVLEDIKAVPGKIGDALGKIGPAIKKKIQSVKDAHADAKMIVKAKNDTNHGGRKDRGKASTLFYTLRDGNKNEKSLQKARQALYDRGTAKDDLPRTVSDRKKRAELLAAQDVQEDTQISGPLVLDQAFITEVTKASAAELFAIMDKVDQTPPIAPREMAKLRFIEMEVAARVQAPGATPMPGGKKK
jgi:hypothetical protein